MTPPLGPEQRELDPSLATVVTCECGWSAIGPQELVVESMQVHGRRIHGRELTRDQVLAKATRP